MNALTPSLTANPPPPAAPGTLGADVSASVVVFLVAVPLCLGIALASGAPLLAGLIAGVVGGIVVGIASGSPLGVSGPAAGLAVIVLSAIEGLGSFEVFLVAVVLAGVIQIALGYARAGIIGYYFPSSVIKGMLSGIGILIILKQIPHALGYDKDPEGSLAFAQADGATTFSSFVDAVRLVSTGPILIAAVSLLVLILWETRWVKRIRPLALTPAPLLVVVVGAVLGVVLSTTGIALEPDQLVRIPVFDGLSGFFGSLTTPDFSGLLVPAVYESAVVLAVIASLETLLCVEATDRLDPLKRVTPTNRELKAQGLGNIVSGLLGGLPVTQVIVRSSANVQAGGRTKKSAILHGVLLAIGIVVLPSLMNTIPLATLAAILLVVGYKLAKPSLFAKLYREGPSQFVPFVATIAGIVLTDLLIGIAIGLGIAIVGLLYESYKIPFQLQRLPDEPDRVRIVLSQQVTFLNKASIVRALAAVPQGSIVEIDATRSAFVHHDVVEIIDDFVASAPARGVQVVVHGLDHVQKGAPSAGIEVAVEPIRSRTP